MGATGTSWASRTKISTDIMQTIDDGVEDAQLKNSSQDIEIENLKDKNTSAKETIKELQDQVSDLKTTIEKLNADLTDLKVITPSNLDEYLAEVSSANTGAVFVLTGSNTSLTSSLSSGKSNVWSFGISRKRNDYNDYVIVVSTASGNNTIYVGRINDSGELLNCQMFSGASAL